MQQSKESLTQVELAWLIELAKTNKIHNFYIWSKWIKVRRFVMEQDKEECQHCKVSGKLRRAALVHHIKHLKVYPQHGLSMWIKERGDWQRQLISLCAECHAKEHPEWFKKTKKPFVNFERWD